MAYFISSGSTCNCCLPRFYRFRFIFFFLFGCEFWTCVARMNMAFHGNERTYAEINDDDDQQTSANFPLRIFILIYSLTCSLSSIKCCKLAHKFYRSNCANCVPYFRREHHSVSTIAATKTTNTTSSSTTPFRIDRISHYMYRYLCCFRTPASYTAC